VSVWLLTTLLSASIGGVVSVVRLWLKLRLFWRVYERGGAADMLDASRAVHLRDRGALARARAVLRPRADRVPPRGGEPEPEA
jgi:hypothetical protein